MPRDLTDHELLDYFAAHALIGLLSNDTILDRSPEHQSIEASAATAAFDIAEAMLNESRMRSPGNWATQQPG